VSSSSPIPPSSVPLVTAVRAPSPLQYDPLPAHSTLVRESAASGGVVITGAAGDVSARARSAAMRATAAAAGVFSAIPIGLGAIVLGPMAWRHRVALPRWTGVLAGVLCAAVFALVWHVLYGRVLAAMERARRQSTIIAVESGRLIVETTGPLGNDSFDVRADEIANVRVDRLRGVVRDNPPPRAACVAVELRHGPTIRLLEGWDEQELEWTSRAIASALARAPAPDA
jgi:hypothetical protein